MIKVLIVDDSALVRKYLAEIINSDPELEVTDTASDPYFAVKKIKSNPPDVITLDIEMPRMDGITFLKAIMAQRPTPVVVISSLTQEKNPVALKALELGALEVLSKPRATGGGEFLKEQRISICNAIKAASKASLSKVKKNKASSVTGSSPKYTADAVLQSKRQDKSLMQTTEKVVAIGASTGGTEALKEVLLKLSYDCPAIVIVQHMPENFTRSFAERLDSLCKVSVKEATDGDSLLRGHVLIAPGNKHMILKRSGARYYVQIKDGPLVNRHRPSVDVLFRSTAQFAGKNSIGILLTGMGADGAKGLLEMRESGAKTIAQDEASSVVFGMPKEAIKMGAATDIVNLQHVASYIK